MLVSGGEVICPSLIAARPIFGNGDEVAVAMDGDETNPLQPLNGTLQVTLTPELLVFGRDVFAQMNDVGRDARVILGADVFEDVTLRYSLSHLHVFTSALSHAKHCADVAV